MKILLIQYCFPPFNVIGSVRAAQLAAYLEGRGHELRIVAGDGLPYPAALALPELKAKIFRARLRSVEAPIDFGRGLLGGAGASTNGSSSGNSGGFLTRAVRMYRALFAVPDGQIGWYPAAMSAANRALEGWSPDVIISSALPFTSHLVASRVARRTGKPWIAEYRDLFSGNPYSEAPFWRGMLDLKIEQAMIKNASAIVAVTPQMSNELERMHGKHTVTVMNGFDIRDAAELIPPVEAGRALKILYTGIVYPGRRDPAPLFEAISSLGERGKRVIVEFYGQDLRGVRVSAAVAGIESQVRIHTPVSYDESLKLQAQADVLLLLLWDDPRERGTLTGKVFEYIGSGRPILAIGCLDGVASTLVRDRGLGETVSESAAIARELNRWIEQIDRDGTISAVPPSARQGLSRAEQFADYDKLIVSLTRNNAVSERALTAVPE